MMHNLELPGQWPEMIRIRRADPPEDPDELRTWLYAQFVPTPHSRLLVAYIDRVMRRNVSTRRQWLALEGSATIGKSETLKDYLLQMAETSEFEWRSRTDEHLHVPCVYIHADSGQYGAGLLHAICTFCGIPPARTEQLMRTSLEQLLPRLGTKLIVVDDAHYYKRVADRSTRLTDSLRAALRLPVSFVFAGTNLQDSALLRRAGMDDHTSEQLERRLQPLHFKPLTIPEDNVAIRDMVLAFGRRARRIPGVQPVGLQNSALIRMMVERTKGRPGELLQFLKDATADALLGDRIVSAELIAAVLPEASMESWYQ
jgi:hypothetical protein